MNEGFWACVGALIGAAIGGYTTYMVSNKTIKLELKKINISFLIDKLRKLESIKKNYDIDYSQTINSENTQKIINDFEFLSKVFNDLSHYFINSNIYQQVSKIYENILIESENEYNDNNSSVGVK